VQESNTAKYCCCANHGIPGKGDPDLRHLRLVASKENSAVKVTHQAPQSEEKGPVHGCQPAKSAKTPQF